MNNIIEYAVVPANPSVDKVLMKDTYYLYVPIATAERAGTVVPDNASILISNGVISVSEEWLKGEYKLFEKELGFVNLITGVGTTIRDLDQTPKHSGYITRVDEVHNNKPNDTFTGSIYQVYDEFFDQRIQLAVGYILIGESIETLSTEDAIYTRTITNDEHVNWTKITNEKEINSIITEINNIKNNVSNNTNSIAEANALIEEIIRAYETHIEDYNNTIRAVVDVLDGKEDKANKNRANGYLGLNADGKVDSAYLPSYVDDVIEVASYDRLPQKGESGKIYITLDDNKTYRWGTTVYVPLSGGGGGGGGADIKVINLEVPSAGTPFTIEAKNVNDMFAVVPPVIQFKYANYDKTLYRFDKSADTVYFGNVMILNGTRYFTRLVCDKQGNAEVNSDEGPVLPNIGVGDTDKVPVVSADGKIVYSDRLGMVENQINDLDATKADKDVALIFIDAGSQALTEGGTFELTLPTSMPIAGDTLYSLKVTDTTSDAIKYFAKTNSMSTANMIEFVEVEDMLDGKEPSVNTLCVDTSTAVENAELNTTTYTVTYAVVKLQNRLSQIDLDNIASIAQMKTDLSNTKDDITNIKNNIIKIANSSGGFAGGYNAKTSGSGFAGGSNSSASTGGAIGKVASASTGGAVGLNAKATEGFSGGREAKSSLDSIQLGKGTNVKYKSMQVYDYTVMNADGTLNSAGKKVATLDENGVIEANQLPSTVDEIYEGTYVDSTTFNKADGTAYDQNKDKIYYDTTSGKTYRWSGSAYVDLVDGKDPRVDDILSNRTKIYALDNGKGFAAGFNSNINGGGCAIGLGANANGGGAIGYGAKAMNGFAGGHSAISGAMNAIQLGMGTNETDRTLQVFDYTVMNADGTLNSGGKKVLVEGEGGGSVPYGFDNDSYIEVKVEDNDQVALTYMSTAEYPQCEIDWGDGSKNSGTTGNVIHTYTKGGTYLIKVKGAFNFYWTPSWQVKITKLQWSNLGNINGMNSKFADCFLLKTLNIDTSKVTDSLAFTFKNCSSISSFPQLDTSQVTNMRGMVMGCRELVNMPLLDTSQVTNMFEMFSSCTKLTTIPQLDTSKVTSMYNMFNTCTKLTTIPLLNTSKVDSMGNMFASCVNLTTIPLLDTSNVNNMYGTFLDCPKLKTIPLLDTSNVNNMSSMFNSCINLLSVPQLDLSSCSSANGIFVGCPNIEEIHMINIKANLDISPCTKMTRQALNEVISNLINVGTSRTLTVGATLKAKLTAEDIAVATAKGWTIA